MTFGSYAGYAEKALEAVKESPDYAARWAKKHPFAAGVAATASLGLIDGGLKAVGVINDGTPATYRFVPYYLNSLACAELNKKRVRNEKERDLTFKERMTSSLYGAIAPTLFWEGWEEVGATEPVYGVLNKAFGGAAKQDFEGKGSFVDLGLTVGAVMLTELGKEGVQYVARRMKRK